jgi:hypothetical protein
MPDNGKLSSDIVTFQDRTEHGLQNVRMHSTAVGSSGQIAVVAVDVAERGRLKDQQLYFMRRARDVHVTN